MSTWFTQRKIAKLRRTIAVLEAEQAVWKQFVVGVKETNSYAIERYSDICSAVARLKERLLQIQPRDERINKQA